MKGLELKDFLTKKGITGASLAEKMGTTRQNISYILNFEGDLKFSRLKEIAKALNISTSEILASDPEFPNVSRIQELEKEIAELKAEICELKAEKKRLLDIIDKLSSQTK